MNSGKKRFKIELEDAEGSKYNLSLEGNVSKEKIMKIVEFMDLINIESNSESNGNNENEIYSRSNRVIPASVGDKIWSIVESKFPYGGFTSTDILELYEDQYNEPIKLSIISTYLSRYAERGRLIRTRQGKEWVYKMTKQQPMQAQPSSSASLDLPL
ncbi:MAG: hypothetical protein M3298_06850 [Thermoproteota archaeon]|jgi:hypothetical protein|nr:hypothetical protein [Thermoproteota archaeon]MDQ3807870.1 hypothetical protein [Thermoproteota archaeon]MDQ5842375.1 hypothetical protein [Thermoproteota archaeon]